MAAPIARFGLAAILVASAAAAHADDWNRSFAVTGHPRVEIATDDGRVRVSTGDARAVMVHVSTTGWHVGPSGVRITPTQEGDHVRVEVREPHFQFGIFVNRRVEVEVTVPREVDLDVTTGDGRVEIPSLEGRIHVHTGDGAIVADGAGGEVSLESGDGSIHATGLQGTLYAHTGDGSMRVSGRFDRLELSSGDGGIEAEAAEGSKVTDGWDLHTGDGSITLRVPRGLAAELEASTGDGSLDLDLPVEIEGRIARHHLHGRLNGGGGLLRLRSGDGGIRISGL